MINHDDERELREIERSLEDDDPTFVTTIRTLEASLAGTAATPLLARDATKIMAAGFVLTVVGFLTSPPLGVVGVLLAVIGTALRLAAQAFRPPTQPRGGDGKRDTGCDDAQT